MQKVVALLAAVIIHTASLGHALDVEKDWGFVLFTNSQFGETLGEELFFYLLLGPNSPVIGIVILLVVLIGFGFLIRWAIRKVKNKHRVGFQMKS